MLMQCSDCHQDLEPNAQFCGNCGAKLATNVAVNTTAQSPTPTARPVASAQAASSAANAAAEMDAAASVQPVVPIVSEQVTPVGQPALAYPVQKQPKSGLSIAGMVLGILSLITSLIFYLSIPLGILAIILSAIGMRKGGKGMAIAGIVLGALGIIASIAIILIVLGYCGSNPNAESCVELNAEATPHLFS